MNYEVPEWVKRDTKRRKEVIKSIKNKIHARAILTRKIVLVAIAIIILTALLLQPYSVTYYNFEEPIHTPELEINTAYATTKMYYVTGYNTVKEQTDSTPCVAASGDNICGRRDVVACPREIPLGTKVEIDGNVYTCLDRLAMKYDHRIDISCDKDFKCPAQVTGYKEVKVLE